MNNIKIGDVVAPHSHPYSSSLTNAIISGEHLLIAPLMIVTETLNVLRDEFSETDGSIVTSKGSSNCKCIWFSSKTNQFEESWFSSTQLKTILEGDNKVNSKAIIGYNVSLKTLELELGKLKSSFSTEQREGENKAKSSINSLLSFVPPVMQVLEVKESTDKDNKFDSKSGFQKKFVPKYTAKCKWYCPSTEKFSEKFLPLECLLAIPKLGNDKLETVDKIISKGAILKIEKTLFKPTSVSYRSGFYKLSGYDFIKNVNREIPLSDETNLSVEPKLYNIEAPNFELIATSVGAAWNSLTSISDLINSTKKDNFYLRIKYKSLDEKITTRTLSKLQLHTTKEITDPLKGEEDVIYLEAYCHLRDAKRFFKLNRIIDAKQLNIKYS
ncbi:WYL domain-containing protein [Pedobacter frigiditerrae]|uniref:WYL domain-containing protein n=1 Tax=Pedobacter frigiditerrae TaxID=2530452 RepID=UPI00292DECDD|nr:WYL domain-containing protein [Pedobacter frigiditerrae]